MILKLISLFIFVFVHNHNVLPHELGSLGDTKVEFPYLAIVRSSARQCNAILISKNLLITPAYCVNNSSSVRVYLTKDDTQTFISTEISTDIVIHENFARLVDINYLNNIALIKLKKPIKSASSARPGNLISKGEVSQIEQNSVKLVNWDFKVTRTQNISLFNQDTCSYLYQTEFLRSQELCANISSKTAVYLGSAVTWKDKIVGFIVTKHKCRDGHPTCGSVSVILNLVSYLDWICEKGNIAIVELTGKSEENNINAILKGTENLEEKIEKSFRKYEQSLQEIKVELTHKSEKDDVIATLNSIENLKEKSERKFGEYEQSLQEIKTDLSEKNDLNAALKSIQNLEEKNEKTFGEYKESLQEIITEVRGKSEKNYHNAALKSIENLEKKIEKIFEKSEQSLHEIKTEMNDIRMKEDENNKKYQEEKNDELRGIINTQNGILKLEAKVEGLTNDMKYLNETLNKIVNFMYNPIVN